MGPAGRSRSAFRIRRARAREIHHCGLPQNRPNRPDLSPAFHPVLQLAIGTTAFPFRAFTMRHSQTARQRHAHSPLTTYHSITHRSLPTHFPRFPHFPWGSASQVSNSLRTSDLRDFASTLPSKKTEKGSPPIGSAIRSSVCFSVAPSLRRSCPTTHLLTTHPRPLPALPSLPLGSATRTLQAIVRPLLTPFPLPKLPSKKSKKGSATQQRLSPAFPCSNFP